MLRKVLIENYEVDQAQLVLSIHRSLEEIQQKLQNEIVNKQAIIDGCSNEIKTLRTKLSGKDETIHKLEAIIAETQRNIEGNRQLINKLLNDLDRRQQDIEWYKRTYESRSLLGTIWEKIFNKTR
jgi:uncharacterized coiled-coil protein SlyX